MELHAWNSMRNPCPSIQFNMYDYRNLSPQMRNEVLEWRKRNGLPWHSPAHGQMGFSDKYLVTAACFEHKRHIGISPDRMNCCEKTLLDFCLEFGSEVFAWCILPNHYHLLIQCALIKTFCKYLGKLHGRLSRQWNKEDDEPGRKVWYRSFDREIRSERHFYASLNYVHHNPVHHKYVESWVDWPWSSAAIYLEKVGREEAEKIWREYPLFDYGKKWDL
ncbi:MAG: transposase [Acidobacteria bacterium]|nr:transposase [Acidobacteriota bacterium]